MAKHFTVFKSREKLQEQWAFLMKIGFMRKIKILKVFSIIIGVASLLYIILIFFTPMDDYIAAKGVLMVLLILSFIAIFLYAISIFIGKYKNKYFLKIYLNSISPDQLNYSVEIKEDTVKIISGVTFKEYAWDNFVSYGIENNTIYVFNESKPRESLYWSLDEMNEENYYFLITLLRSKSVNQLF